MYKQFCRRLSVVIFLSAALAKRHRGEQEVKQEGSIGCGFIISSLTSVSFAFKETGFLPQTAADPP